MATAYITKAELTSLGCDLSNLSEAVQDSICLAASIIVDGYLGQPLGSNQHTEIHKIKPNNINNFKIFSNCLPVTDITSIKQYFQGVEINSCTTWQIFNNEGYIEIYQANDLTEQTIQIVYTAGYAVIPSEAIKAVLIVAGMLINDYNSGAAFSFTDAVSMKQGNVSVSRQVIDGIPKLAKILLTDYKRGR